MFYDHIPVQKKEQHTGYIEQHRPVHNESQRQFLGSFFFDHHNSGIPEHLSQQNARPIVPTSDLLGIDISFVARKTAKHLLQPVSFCDTDNCVGVKVLWDEENDVSYVRTKKLDNHEVNILYISPSQLAEWGTYYQSTDEALPINALPPTSLPEKKILRFPKFDTDVAHSTKKEQLFQAIQQSQYDLSRLNIEIDAKASEDAQKEFGLDIVFCSMVGNKRELCFAPMFEMLQYTKLKTGEIDRTTKHSPQVVAIYIPPDGETLETSINKVKQKRRKLLAKLDLATALQTSPNFDVYPEIAIATDEQIQLWKKRGYFGELKSHREDAVELGKVLDVLESAGIEDHCLVRKHSVTNKQVDLMFFKKNGDQRYPGEPAMFRMRGIQDNKLEWVEHCIGAMCFEQNISDSNRISIARSAMNEHRTFFMNESRTYMPFKILSITPQLLKIWEDLLSMGEPIFEFEAENTPERAPQFDEEPRAERPAFTSSPVSKIIYQTHEHSAPSIGAKVSFIRVQFEDGTEENVILDFGSQYENFDWDSLTKPSFELGFIPFEGVLPKQIALYRTSLHLKAAEYMGESFLENPENNFSLQDLYQTLSESDFERVVRYCSPDTDIEDLREELKGLQDDLNTVYSAILFSHAHADHMDFAGVLNGHIRQLWSEEAAPWGLFKFLTNGSYLTEAMIRRHRATILSPRTDRRYSPPLSFMKPYEEVFIGKGKISVRMLPCDHSIYGAGQFLITIYDQFQKPLQKILYTGDYRFGDTGLTELSVKYLEQVGVDTVITDTTNIAPGAEEKPSLKVTPEKMHRSFYEAISKSEGMTIVQMAPNNLQDAHLVAQIAKVLGKTVVTDMKRAIALQAYAQFDEALQATDHPFNWEAFHPRLRLGSDVAVYQQPKATRKQADTFLQNQYSGQTYNTRTLTQNEKDIVLLIPPVPGLKQQLAHLTFKHRPTIIRAHYYPYNDFDKDNTRRDYYFCKQQGYNYLCDLEFRGGNIFGAADPKYRMSGHAKKQDFIQFMATLKQKNPDLKIIPVHGAHRGHVTKVLKEELGENTDIVSKMDKGTFTLQLY